MVAEKIYSSEGMEPVNEDKVAVNITLTTVPDWTEAEERRAKRKVDFILLPILGLAFFALQCDRGNISNALTSTITKDLGVTTNQINNGNSLLYIGIVLLEIPSNILLQKIGPQRWLAFQITSWGLIATFQAFVTNYAGYLATRILLGCFEAGFIPGSLYTMSTWYKKSETSLRISIFFLGNILASATASLIGAGILTMSGRDGVAGWRWLFIIEGSITVAVGIIFILLLPPKVGNGRPLIGFGKFNYFTAREEYILVRRVLLDDPAKTDSHISISRREVWQTAKNPRIWIHLLITLTATISVNAVNTYSPSIIKSLGWTSVQANALNSVGSFIAAIIIVILGFIADKTDRRGPPTLIGATFALISYTVLKQSIHWAKGNRYAAIVAATAANSIIHIINVGWLSLNCTHPQQRSIAMAMIIMAANAAGVAGSQVFRASDAPLYPHAFTAMLSLAAVCFTAVIALMVWYFLSNKRLDKAGATEPIQGNPDAETVAGSGAGAGGEIKKPWRFTW